jgi:hypothetical protein
VYFHQSGIITSIETDNLKEENDRHFVHRLLKWVVDDDNGSHSHDDGGGGGGSSILIC